MNLLQKQLWNYKILEERCFIDDDVTLTSKSILIQYGKHLKTEILQIFSNKSQVYQIRGCNAYNRIQTVKP